MYYSPGVFRKKALTALKGHWQTALLIALIVNLPTLLMQGVSVFTGNDLMDRLQAVVVSASRDGIMTRELPLDEIQALMNSSGFWIIRGLELLAWLVTPCLSLGMYRWLTGRLQGQEEPVSTVFCRINLFFKAIGLQLMIILKVLLWMLPGFAAGLLAVYMALRNQGSSALQSVYSMTLPMILLTAVPGVMAALRCALAEYIMADRPESRILFCIRRSKELMKDRKKYLFTMLLMFLLWYMLELLVSSLLPGVFSLLFQMLAGLALSVWMAGSVAAFRLHAEELYASNAGPDAEPAPDELN